MLPSIPCAKRMTSPPPTTQIKDVIQVDGQGVNYPQPRQNVPETKKKKKGKGKEKRKLRCAKPDPNS
jgi:hypothetical protein